MRLTEDDICLQGVPISPESELNDNQGTDFQKNLPARSAGRFILL